MPSQEPGGQAAYGNWVTSKILWISAALTLVFIGLSFWLPILAVLAAIFAIIFLYFLYAWRCFSPRGGNLQVKIRQLVLEHLDWDGQGQALDIGCGSAALGIALAKNHPQAKVVGIDYWGAAWDYSQNLCQQNAAAEEVADRMEFQKASASSLPFADETFDAAVSNMVFHEVKDAKDKREVIKEALRVVKKGGSFAFQDLLFWRKIYGPTEGLVEYIKELGVESVEFVPTRDLGLVPGALKLPFMLGPMGLIHGRK